MIDRAGAAANEKRVMDKFVKRWILAAEREERSKRPKLTSRQIYEKQWRFAFTPGATIVPKPPPIKRVYHAAPQWGSDHHPQRNDVSAIFVGPSGLSKMVPIELDYSLTVGDVP